jgi:peptidyl-prolyl cis-trans isomerase
MEKNMKKKLKVFIAGLISMSLLVGCATDKLGKTVATVNGENITYGEYLKKFAFQKYMIDSTYGKEIWNEKVPAEQSITKQETTLIKDFTLRLVDSIIQEELLSQEAKKQSLKIDESELKNNVDQWKNSITKDTTAKEYYEKNGITEEVVTDIFKEQMNISALEANYTKNNPVTQAEIDKYYNEHKSEYTNAQVKASHIIIKTQNDDGTEMSQDKVDSAKKQIDEIYAKIKAGEDFAKLAKQYSQDASKDAGGDLGFFSKGQMVKEFEEVAFSMKVGEVSEPFKTKYGYHVVKLTDKKEDTTDPKQVKEFLKGTLQQEKFNKYVEELKKAAKITKDEKVVENAEKDIKEVEIKSQTSITDKATEGSNTKTDNKEKTQENTKKTEDKK